MNRLRASVIENAEALSENRVGKYPAMPVEKSARTLRSKDIKLGFMEEHVLLINRIEEVYDVFVNSGIEGNMIKDLNRENSLELVRRGRLARLACIVNGEPYIVPVNYIFDGESIIVHSLPGRKISAMRTNPRVCFQIDEIDDELNWKSVLAYGNYEEIINASERARALNHLLSCFPNLTPVETMMANDAGTPMPLAFRVRIDTVTGISEGR